MKTFLKLLGLLLFGLLLSLDFCTAQNRIEAVALRCNIVNVETGKSTGWVDVRNQNIKITVTDNVIKIWAQFYQEIHTIYQMESLYEGVSQWMAENHKGINCKVSIGPAIHEEVRQTGVVRIAIEYSDLMFMYDAEQSQ